VGESQKTRTNDKDRVGQAVELLAEELRSRLRSHPGGHLLIGGGGAVTVAVRLPISPREGELAAAAGATGEELTDELQALLLQRAVFRPGRVWCLRCASAECEHSAPASSREVFTGYGPTGLPRFADFGSWLLSRGDPRVDLLYETPPRFLAVAATGEALTADLLAAYSKGDEGYRLHGQVVGGWYRGTGPDGHPDLVAVSFQIASSQTGKNRRRLYGLNVVAAGPGGEDLEAFCNRLDAIPWAVPVRWAQTVLSEIGLSKRGSQGGREKRIQGLLRGLAARLEKDRRAAGRRTLHAAERHTSGERPTRMALADLGRAAGEAILVDTRRDTLVVLGERGRAHIFNRDGKLVTSVRYNTDSIARRQKNGLWRPARAEEAASLRIQVAEADARE